MFNRIILVALAALTPLAAFSAETPGSHFIENWDADANGAVSLEEVTERRGDVFRMFDSDDDGLLSAQEYVLFDETRAADMQNNAGGHGKGGGRLQVGLTLEFNDTDASGDVSHDEFVGNSAAWFGQMDRDTDGQITAADFGPKSN